MVIENKPVVTLLVKYDKYLFKYLNILNDPCDVFLQFSSQQRIMRRVSNIDQLSVGDVIVFTYYLIAHEGIVSKIEKKN